MFSEDVLEPVRKRCFESFLPAPHYNSSMPQVGFLWFLFLARASHQQLTSIFNRIVEWHGYASVTGSAGWAPQLEFGISPVKTCLLGIEQLGATLLASENVRRKNSYPLRLLRKREPKFPFVSPWANCFYLGTHPIYFDLVSSNWHPTYSTFRSLFPPTSTT